MWNLRLAKHLVHNFSCLGKISWPQNVDLGALLGGNLALDSEAPWWGASTLWPTSTSEVSHRRDASPHLHSACHPFFMPAHCSPWAETSTKLLLGVQCPRPRRIRVFKTLLLSGLKSRRPNGGQASGEVKGLLCKTKICTWNFKSV